VFRQQLQPAIEFGRIKFNSSKAQKPMKIEQHPFPTNMLDAKGKTKVLTSEAAERSELVDPQHQITSMTPKARFDIGRHQLKKASSVWHCNYS